MYLRLLVTIPLAFYTSRVVIRQLGVDDFGIYQAVAGIITMFAILRGTFDSATQRFYNVAIAKDDNQLLSKLFSASILVQLILVLLLVTIIEVFGLWFIKNKMNYPCGSESDVYFVFHTMVISVIFIVIIIPFSGMIVAREHMKFYAYLSIVDVLMKFGLVFMLIFISYNKLRIYALFQMFVPLVLLLMSVIYFRKNFKDVRLSKPNIGIIKEMTVFSGWGLLGNVCYSLVNEGVNLLLNVFGGVLANTARGIAFQVRGVISNVLTTTVMPVRPQATQIYINENYDEFWGLIYTYSKIIFFLASIMVIPIFVFATEIIQLWLSMTPQYSIIFLQIIMIYTLIRSFHEPLDIVFKASGRMKAYQITSVCISSLTFFLGWLSLILGASIYMPFIIFCTIEIVLLITLVMLARKEGINIPIYFKKVLLPCLVYSLMGIIVCNILKALITWWFLSILFCIVVLLLLGFAFMLNKRERDMIKSKVLRNNFSK